MKAKRRDGPASSGNRDMKFAAAFRNFGQVLNVITLFAPNRKHNLDFWVFDCGVGVHLSGFNEFREDANDFFDVVEEQSGWWELAGNFWLFCLDRHLCILYQSCITAVLMPKAITAGPLPSCQRPSPSYFPVFFNSSSRLTGVSGPSNLSKPRLFALIVTTSPALSLLTVPTNATGELDLAAFNRKGSGGGRSPWTHLREAHHPAGRPPPSSWRKLRLCCQSIRAGT